MAVALAHLRTAERRHGEASFRSGTTSRSPATSPRSISRQEPVNLRLAEVLGREEDIHLEGGPGPPSWWDLDRCDSDEVREAWRDRLSR